MCMHTDLEIYIYNYKCRYRSHVSNTFTSLDPETKHMFNFKAMK